MATSRIFRKGTPIDFGESHSISVFNYVGYINADFVNSLIAHIKESLGVDEIIINLSSPGGNVIHGVTAYNLLSNYVGSVIHTNNIGEVSSAAILPFLAGRIRTAAPVSKFMFHPISLACPNELSYPKAQELITMMEHDIANYSAIVHAAIPKFCEHNNIEEILRHDTLILPSADGEMYDLLSPDGR